MNNRMTGMQQLPAASAPRTDTVTTILLGVSDASGALVKRLEDLYQSITGAPVDFNRHAPQAPQAVACDHGVMNLANQTGARIQTISFLVSEIEALI